MCSNVVAALGRCWYVVVEVSGLVLGLRALWIRQSRHLSPLAQCDLTAIADRLWCAAQWL